MALKVGRVTLSDPLGITFKRRTAERPGVGGPFYEKGFVVRGREASATAQTTMDSLELESFRYGHVYVADDNSNIPTGWYRLEDVDYEKPSGKPKLRPWALSIIKKELPIVQRQAQNDNVAGADTADVDADEDLKVVYTPTTSDVVVLRPRTVSGAEAVNLPSETYKAVMRVRSTGGFTSQKYRWRLTNTGGTVLATGSQRTASVSDAWTEVDLGALTVPSANDKANWYEVLVQGVTGELGAVWLDRLRIFPT
jgi:hypothetical protein